MIKQCTLFAKIDKKYNGVRLSGNVSELPIKHQVLNVFVPESSTFLFLHKYEMQKKGDTDKIVPNGRRLKTRPKQPKSRVTIRMCLIAE